VNRHALLAADAMLLLSACSNLETLEASPEQVQQMIIAAGPARVL